MSQPGKHPSLIEQLKVYGDKRLLVIFLMGISSGFPWVLIGSAMSAWLKDAGIDRATIGLFGSIFTAYAINFLWAPFIDRLDIPWLARLAGRRRAWILSTQALILLTCMALSLTQPNQQLMLMSLLALLIAIASATQDIVINAYRIESLAAHETEKIPAGSAMATAGWWTGYQLLGAPAFYLAGAGMHWSQVYLGLAGIMALLMAAIWWLSHEPPPRPQSVSPPSQYQQWLLRNTSNARFAAAAAWLATTVIDPVAEFFRRNGWRLALAIISFLFLFKLGEAFLGRMSIVFYKEVGFTDTQIATYSKLMGWWVTIVFSLLGSLLNSRFGIVKGLLLGGIAMSATNLLFAWIAMIGPDTTAFAIAIIADGFTGAFSTVAFVAFISYLTSRNFTASQYALLAAIGNFGRTTVASFSGQMVDWLQGNWTIFFVLTSVMVIPSLIILLWIGQHFERAANQQHQQEP